MGKCYKTIWDIQSFNINIYIQILENYAYVHFNFCYYYLMQQKVPFLGISGLKIADLLKRSKRKKWLLLFFLPYFHYFCIYIFLSFATKSFKTNLMPQKLLPLIATYGCYLWLLPLVATYGCYLWLLTLVATYGCYLW